MPTREKITIEQLNKSLSDVGDIVVSEKYITGQKIKILCHKCKEIYEKNATHVFRGQRCIHCAINSGKYKIQHTEEYIEKFINDNGDELISTYTNSHTKMQIKCGKMDIYSIWIGVNIG